MARELSDQQKLFLEVLFTKEVAGDFQKAKVLAGYSPTYATSSLLKSLEEEVLKATREFISRIAPKAAFSLGDILSDPTQLGVRDKLAVAKDVLDRVGIVKTEKMEITGSSVFILPPKNVEEEEEA